MEVVTKDRMTTCNDSSSAYRGGGEEHVALKKELFLQASVSGDKADSTSNDDQADLRNSTMQSREYSNEKGEQDQQQYNGDEEKECETESDLNMSCVSMSDIMLPQFDTDIVEWEGEGKCEEETKRNGEIDGRSASLTNTEGSTGEGGGAGRPIIVFFRVAFMGCLEFADEWVEAFTGTAFTSSCSVEVSRSSLLLAPLGSRAQQRRGYYQTRPEMKYVVDLHRLKKRQQQQLLQKDQGEAVVGCSPLALSPCSTLVNPFFARVVDVFLRAGGMEAMLAVCGEGGREQEQERRLDMQEPAKTSTVLVLLSSFSFMSEVNVFPFARSHFCFVC